MVNEKIKQRKLTEKLVDVICNPQSLLMAACLGGVVLGYGCYIGVKNIENEGGVFLPKETIHTIIAYDIDKNGTPDYVLQGFLGYRGMSNGYIKRKPTLDEVEKYKTIVEEKRKNCF